MKKKERLKDWTKFNKKKKIFLKRKKIWQSTSFHFTFIQRSIDGACHFDSKEISTKFSCAFAKNKQLFKFN